MLEGIDKLDRLRWHRLYFRFLKFQKMSNFIFQILIFKFHFSNFEGSKIGSLEYYKFQILNFHFSNFKFGQIPQISMFIKFLKILISYQHWRRYIDRIFDEMWRWNLAKFNEFWRDLMMKFGGEFWWNLTTNFEWNLSLWNLSFFWAFQIWNLGFW